MAFYDDTSFGYVANDGGFGGGSDWYDGGDFYSPMDGGYPGGIPGYDDYTIGELAPVNPGDVLSPTVEAPYDPYADDGPSQTNPNVVGKDDTIPDTGEVVITDDRPVAPEDLPDMGEMVITGSTPRETPPSITIDQIVAPDLELPDLTPYLPEEDIPEMVIKADKPVIEVPDTEIPLITAPDILEPAPPIEDDIPELIIEDKKEPVVPDIIEDPIVEPEIPEDIVEPEPPIIDLPPVLPPVVRPPVEPPNVTPRPPTQTGGAYLNPGMIETTPFYKTTNDVQNRYYWGDRALQYGDTFNAKTWNDVPDAPKTPFGIQELGKPMTLQAAMNIIQGVQTNYSSLSPAENAYIAMLDPESAQQFLRRKGLV